MNHIQKFIDQYDSSFFHYDLDAFERHLKSIRAILHPDIKVFYACKANPLSKILSILNDQGFGVDVASLGELKQATTSGVTKLIATGPAKSLSYLNKLLDSKVSTVIIESLTQLKDLNTLAAERGISQDVLLRVQLDWERESKSVLGGSAITPFGLGIEDWKKIEVLEYSHLKIMGLHCFQWGNILDLNELKVIWDSTIKSCIDLAQTLNIQLQVLDLGGGLGISYSDDREILFKDVHELLLGFKNQYSLNEIWLELGRFCIGTFGSYYTKIVDIKSVRGKNIIVTEGGINHLSRPALVKEGFPCKAFKLSSQSLRKFSVHGPLCTALDHLGDYNLPENLSIGDWLEFKKSGAYGFTESMPYFLCHSLAAEVYTYQLELSVPRAPASSSEWMV